MDMTERVLRSETDMLKKQELIKVKSTGMEITMKVLKSYRNSVITSMFIVMTIEWLEQLKKSSTLKMFMLFQVIQIRIKQLKRNRKTGWSVTRKYFI